VENIEKYCNECDIKGYCDKTPTDCPIAKEYKRIADFEKAKAELKSELSKPVIKFLDWLENKLQRIEKWWHNG
jgi:hypothetical protein